MASSTDTCSLCVDQSNGEAGEQTWLQCDACSAWYHAHCLKIPVAEVNDFETYHCSACVAGHGPSTLKPARRKSQRESIRLNYADMNEGLSGDEKIWGKLLKTKTFAPDRFTRYKGDQISLSRFRKSGMTEPFVIEDPAGLDMTMPPGDTSISAIADFVGEDRPVEVIDVATQASSPGWTMKKWANYVETPPDKRDRIRNVISLEISSTDFGKKMVRPRLVRDMDWIDQVWPAELKPKEYPKVQLYCLMGTQDSYTDFHIDFGGTSVFYHILRGSKVFYFIEPTSKNLKKYQKWSSSPDQSAVFLGDLVKTCYAVHLHAGNTMIIPTGWIHAVYTPEDALVIGGNFLHGLNIGTQLKIYDIEEITKVPDKFRFPFFKRINWYAVEKCSSRCVCV
ncbi:Clavaminate synthase-like protein [Hesseltinella vesiculosa]|uniref:JmjC domain-containing histone demethylation protein 1 n=1 Tax=Hesseltinella vesiculosa TaxID=101127 RepID=A0A1X2GV05_9FUNG|nr:Clavaminate synthase-like protein [Hesseltinella vesiculosa]